MREQIGVTSHLVNVDPVLLPVCQAPPYEVLERGGGIVSIDCMSVRCFLSLIIQETYFKAEVQNFYGQSIKVCYVQGLANVFSVFHIIFFMKLLSISYNAVFQDF